MPRMVDAEALDVALYELEKRHNGALFPQLLAGIRKARGVVVLAPTVTEVSVVHARWTECAKNNDVEEYADYIAYLARTEMGMVFWECGNCRAFDHGAPTRQPPYCRHCGAKMDAAPTEGGKP